MRDSRHLLAPLILRCSALFVLTAVAVAADAPASKPKSPPDKPQKLIAPYWTLEPGWHTSLEIRNNYAARPLTVTPILRTASGEQLTLDAIDLKPSEGRRIDLALATVKYPPLLGDRAYGSVVLQFTSAMAFNVYAATMVHMPGKAIAYHFDATDELSGFGAGTYEGIWWMPSTTAHGQMMISNTSDQPVNANVTWFDSNGATQSTPLGLAAGQSRRLDVRDAITRGNLAGDHGGLRIQLDAKAGSVFLGHILYDETANFGGTVKMFEKYKFHSKATTNTIRAPMIALTEPDAALNFPAGTKLNPTVFVRNTTAAPKDVSLMIRWFEGDKSAAVTVPLGPLAANETRALSLRQLQNDGVLPSSAHFAAVHFTYQGDTGDLVALAASYDDTLRYGAQSPFGDMVSHMLVGTLWTADVLHNSIITVGNAGTNPAEVAITLVSADGTFRYELPHAMLSASEQTWVNIGQLVNNHVPDRKGKVFPDGTTSGTYEIEDVKNLPNGYLYEGKLVMDKTYGHVGYGCAQCCGYNQPTETEDPLLGPLPNGNDQKVWATNCVGTPNDVTPWTYQWFTYDANVATVSEGGHVITGAPGFTIVTSYADLEAPGGHICPIETRTTDAQIVVNGFDLSPAQSIVDGNSSQFTISVTGGSPIAYAWSFTAPAGAGNNPNVTFGSPAALQTDTDGHWFALPNTACGAGYNAQYTINAKVTFDDNQEINKNTTLTVSIPSTAAFVDPNVANISGSPDDSQDPTTHKWTITGTGTMARVVPVSATYNIPATSQFRHKAEIHEGVHLANWIQGAGHLFGDLFLVADLYNQIKDLTGDTEFDLLDQVRQVKVAYINDQRSTVQGRLSQDEQQAYSASDPVPPQYKYQGSCGGL